MTDSHPNSSAEKKGTRLGLWFPRNNTLPCRDPTAHFAYPVGQSRVLESATRLVVVPLFMAFGWLSSRDIPRVSSRSTSSGKCPAPPVSQI
jgi:sirohydrochlorin ferrochelatase